MEGGTFRPKKLLNTEWAFEKEIHQAKYDAERQLCQLPACQIGEAHTTNGFILYCFSSQKIKQAKQLMRHLAHLKIPST